MHVFVLPIASILLHTIIKSNSIVIFAIGTIYLFICEFIENTMLKTLWIGEHTHLCKVRGESILIVVLVAVVAITIVIVNIIIQSHTYTIALALALSLFLFLFLFFFSFSHGHLHSWRLFNSWKYSFQPNHPSSTKHFYSTGSQILKFFVALLFPFSFIICTETQIFPQTQRLTFFFFSQSVPITFSFFHYA